MAILDLIKKKRDGGELTEEEVREFALQSATGQVHEAQIAAMLMAIYFQGFNENETFSLTKAMIESGEVLQWDGLTVDKHSTGGVGDKVSLTLAPALAANGVSVPMLSGRGLDFTGGTLDKLESIPGLKVELTQEEISNCIKKCGAVICSTTSSFCPSDKVLYKIRDTTATVDCQPLIIASILSKKVAEGVKHLILDIKVGKSALYKDIESARSLGLDMIAVLKKLNVNGKVALTRMDHPLGNYVGNSLEVLESVKMMKGEKPPALHQLVCCLGGELLNMCGKARSKEEGEKLIDTALSNGKALSHFQDMIVTQGVDEKVAHTLCHGDPMSVLPKSKYQVEFRAPSSGYVCSIDAKQIAIVCRELGGLRKIPGEKIDLSVGAYIEAHIGARVQKGDCWMVLHHNIPLGEMLAEQLRNSIKISDKPVKEENVVIEILS